MLMLLPTSFALLLFLSLQLFVLRGDERIVHCEAHALKGHLRLLQATLSSVEMDKYETLPTKRKSSPDTTNPNPKQEKERTKAFESPRDLYPLPDVAKFNLFFLTDASDFIFKKTVLQGAQTLIKQLYERASFYQEGMEKTFLEYCIEEARKYPKATSFEELLKDLLSISFVHKMLKGTANYQLFSSEGYPPLSDFFIYIQNKTFPKPLLFRYTHRLILQALCGKEQTDQIMEAEKVQWEGGKAEKYLTKEKLKQIISPPFEELFSFGHVAHAKQKKIMTDPSTKIKIELHP